MKMDVNVRLATTGDLPAIVDIYNYEVLWSTATFDTVPTTLAQRQAWLQGHDKVRHPVVVAELGDAVAGWASLSSWSDRCAYARAAEVSVYVHHAQRARGIGRALLEDIIARASSAGLGVVLARICTGEGPASLRLHTAAGFQPIGTMRSVGEKFGRILDVALLDLHLPRRRS